MFSSLYSSWVSGGLKGRPSGFQLALQQKHFYSQSFSKSKAMIFFLPPQISRKGVSEGSFTDETSKRQALLQCNFHHERPSLKKVHVKLPFPQCSIIKATGSSGFLKPISMSNVLGLYPFTAYPSVGFDMVSMTQWCSTEWDFALLGISGNVYKHSGWAGQKRSASGIH